MSVVGRAFLLKAGTGVPVVYRTIAGLHAQSLSISRGECQCEASISATGIFLGSGAEAHVHANAMNGTLDDYELSFENGDRIRGKFLILKLDYAGDFNGERNYTIQLESSDAIMTAGPPPPHVHAAIQRADNASRTSPSLGLWINARLREAKRVSQGWRGSRPSDSEAREDRACYAALDALDAHFKPQELI